MYIGESQAKGIVKRALREWKGTASELEDALYSIFANHRGINTTKKRDERIRKSFKKAAPHMYMKEVKVPINSTINFFGYSDRTSEIPKDITKAQRRKRRLILQQENQLKREAEKNTIFAFVVNLDTSSENTDINIMILNTESDLQFRPGLSLFGLHSVVTITKHCLERIVQRMNFSNINEALDEIVDSLPLLLASSDELLRRPSVDYGADGFKRNIPTTNGALLLKSDLIDTDNEIPIMVTTLVTWIHKDQFRATQGVSTSDFIFSLLINELVSNSRISQDIVEYQAIVKKIEAVEGTKRVDIVALGQKYPAQKFINTLEDRKYLDFIIDFE